MALMGLRTMLVFLIYTALYTVVGATTTKTSSSSTKSSTTSSTACVPTVTVGIYLGSVTTTYIPTCIPTVTKSYSTSLSSTSSMSSSSSSVSSSSSSSSVTSSVSVTSNTTSFSSTTLSTRIAGDATTTYNSTSLSSTSTPSNSSSVSSSRTSSSAAASSSAANTTSLLNNANVAATILLIVRDSATASIASMGLNGYGIPYQTLLVPSGGVALPTLNTTAGGNFGGIIVASSVSYADSAGNYDSALTTAQWNQLYAYQTAYGVRMVQYDVWPDSTFGVTALGGCCGSDVEQLVYFTNTTAFKQAGLKTGSAAGMSTENLYHYPATVSDSTTTWAIASFAANSAAGYSSVSTAAVINNFKGREQMAFFLPFSQDWSATSSYLQHAYITWMTRGLYAGYRRVNLNTQIDDMFLSTDIYYGSSSGTYRVTPTDMAAIGSWVTTINAKMNTGSSYKPEIGHNGNGNIISAEQATNGASYCTPGSIQYADCHCNTDLEYVKPLGTGANVWPSNMTTYGYSSSCTKLDTLETWFATTTNRDNFYHISHTFTHLELDNATYSDALKEIQFNQAWLSQVGIAAGGFTSDGLIPPAISGLHNGDVLRAWSDAGLTHAVGDNTRPSLLNTDNAMWPYMTTTSADGYSGFQINPRWATRIYYNCDTGVCTTQEWIDISSGSGSFTNLLATEKADTTRHLMGLYHDPYMFHQANLRVTGVNSTTINGVSSKISIFQAWVETNVQEFVRLVNWPLITQKQSEIATGYAARMARDQCGYGLTWVTSKGYITGIKVTANGNTCSSPVPVTVPGSVTDTQGFTTEQIGNDPLTIWVTLSGAAVTFTLSSPVALL